MQPSARDTGHWLALTAVLILGLAAALYLYGLDKYALIYYGDAASHLVGARKIVDSVNPGLRQIGTVWLPLPHFLLLPFALVDPLFTTGFAGVAVGLPSLAVTSALLYKMVKAYAAGGAAYIAFAAAFLYATNPNVLYLGLTAMTEAPFMLFFVASAYYFQKWYGNQDRLQNLAYCSIFVTLATLCRYEAWILPPFLMAIVAISAARKTTMTRQQVYAVLLSFLSISGVVSWVAYNAYKYGDPLEFANAKYYSAASHALEGQVRNSLFLKPANVLSIYGIMAVAVYGPVLLALALAGYVFHRDLEGRRERMMLHMFLAFPAVLTPLLMVAGIAEIFFLFNSRFLVLMSPLVILLASMFLTVGQERARKNHVVTAAVLAALFAYQLASPAFLVPTYLDAKLQFGFTVHNDAARAGEKLGSIYDGGNVMTLTGSAQAHRIMITAGIPLRHYDVITESGTWKDSFKEPWLYDRWVVIGKDPDADGVKTAQYWAEERRATLDGHYRLVYENKSYEILTLVQRQAP